MESLFEEIEQKKKVAYFVNYNDVERWICKRYGFKEYCIPALHETGNDTELKFHIVDNYQMDLDDWTNVEKFRGKDCGMMWATRKLLCQMARENVIPYGEYVISISW